MCRTKPAGCERQAREDDAKARQAQAELAKKKEELAATQSGPGPGKVVRSKADKELLRAQRLEKTE
ncbi:unnamed protein product, partial [Effrenium voratum]